MSLKDWSTTAASNNASPPNGWPEGMTIANVNNTARQLMADIRNLAAEDTIASATTCDLGTKDATFLTVSGTTTITGFGTVSAGIYKFVKFSGALTLTHNSTSLILLTGANRTTVAGDCGLYKSEGSGNWREYLYSNVGGSAALVALAASGGSDLVGFLQAGTGAVATTLQARERLRASAFDFFTVAQQNDAALGFATLDVTTAVQAAETYATSIGAILEWPACTVKITDTISRGTFSQWEGKHKNQGTPGSMNGTKILFQPTSAKSLFVPSGAAALYRVGYLTDGFFIVGNSADASGNSIYAFDNHGINKSRFANLTISGFRYGMRNYGTINNRFEFVSIVNSYIASVLYDGGYCTTDVWDQFYTANAPIGVQTNGSNLGIRFINPIFESITTYGMNIVKESWGFEVTTPYVEDTPSANVSTNAMFRVGFDGTTLAASGCQLAVKGGVLGGRNAGAVGALLDVDYTDGVQLGGFHGTRYTNVVRTSANTQTGQIVAAGWTQASVSAAVSDATKVEGFYPEGSFNSSTRNAQNLKTRRLALYGAAPADGTGISFPSGQSASTDPNTLDDYQEYTAASTACTGAITTAVVWKATKVGNQVTLTLPPTFGTASAATNFEYGVVLPSDFRPSDTTVFPCAVKDNDANQSTPGMIFINASTGAIKVYKDMTAASNFTAGVTAGIGQSAATAVSWTV